jgi:uncharacterized protein YkwD
MINDLFTHINTFRVANGVRALSADALGAKQAELRASQFAAYMQTHIPGTPGFNPHEGYDTTAASIGYRIVSENLAFMSIDPTNIVYSIWQGPLHRSAMLAADANVAGVSCVYSNGTAYWTYEPGISSSPTPPPSGGGTSTPPPSGGGTSTPPPSGGGSANLDSEESAFLTILNNYRAQNGVGPLQVSAALQNAARWMSNDMAANNRASHIDSLGRSPQARFEAFGYSSYPSGENIAGGFPDAQTVFNQWLNACDPDPTGTCTYAHRRNMLGSGYAATGIARAYNFNSAYGWYWTNDFGGSVDQPSTPPPTGSAPVIGFFNATPASLSPGQSSTLQWSVTGATAVTIDNGIGTVTGTSLRVTPAQTTTYRINAANNWGTTSATVTVTVVPVVPTGDTQPPTTPGNLTVLATGAPSVVLSWTASADNVGVFSYQILRNGGVYASLPSTARSFTDAAVSAGTTYIYSVRAFDAAGNTSAPTPSVPVTTPAAAGSNACPGAATNAFSGCYYNGIDLMGNPALVRTDPRIDFDWFSQAPSPAVNGDSFSVRWRGTFNFRQGETTFRATMSDGMRVYIDGLLVLDRWRDQSETTYAFRRTLTEGQHLIVVEFYSHNRFPIARLSWE